MSLGSLAAAANGRSTAFSRKVALQGSGLQLRPSILAKKPSGNNNNCVPAERQLAEEIGLQGLDILSNLIEEMVGNLVGVDAFNSDIQKGQAVNRGNIPFHIASAQLQRVSSGHVESIGVQDSTSLRHSLVPVVKNYGHSEISTIENSNEAEGDPGVQQLEAADELLIAIRNRECRQLDPVVANGSYYGRKRYDSLLLELDGYKENSVGSGGIVIPFPAGHRDAIIVHAAKALVFFRISSLKLISEEWALVQYYDVANKTKCRGRSKLSDE